jgi:hypothetical protein
MGADKLGGFSNRAARDRQIEALVQVTDHRALTRRRRPGEGAA